MAQAPGRLRSSGMTFTTPRVIPTLSKAVLGAVARVLIAFVLLVTEVTLAAPPAHAAWTSPTKNMDCASALECLVPAVTQVQNGVEVQVPTTTAWQFIPVSTDAGYGPGVYTLRYPKVAGQPDFCLTDLGDGIVPFPCGGIGPVTIDAWRQSWYLEPLGTGARRNVDPATWNPWSNPGAADAFIIRNVTATWDCVTFSSDGTVGRLSNCSGANALSGSAALTLQTITDASDGGFKSDARMQETKAALLGGAFDRAANTCIVLKSSNWCKVQLKDQVTGEPITDWSRLGSVTLTKAPTAVLTSTACAGSAGGGGAQTIYNGSDQDMSTTIGASATSEQSTSITDGITLGAEIGAEGEFFKASFSISVSREYGRTWTESRTVSQETNWTIPPRHYATAVMSTTGAKMRASWQFGPDNNPNTWRANDVVDLTVPYSSSPGATAPDSAMSLYNSWGRKDCDAYPASTLASGKQVGVENTSAPSVDAAPKIGDVLAAVVDTTASGDDRWWNLGSGDTAEPVLQYQWYRVQGVEDPQAIPGAWGPTYKVTGDDIVDPEIIDRVGPYHLFVGVTDVASARRFDSREYYSLLTSSTVETRDDSDPTGTLELTIANPDDEATNQTRIELQAEISGGNASPAGAVEIYDNDGTSPIATVTLNGQGKGRASLTLGVGPHDLFALYVGDSTPLQGVRTATWRTTVKSAATSTWLVVRDGAAMGEAVSIRAVVTGAGGKATGKVTFYDEGADPLGSAVVDANGMATLRFEGFTKSGTRQVWAFYEGDQTYSSSRSQTAKVKVTKRVIPTKTSLVLTYANGRLNLQAQVSTVGQPKGTIVFSRNGRTLAKRTLTSAGAFYSVKGRPANGTSFKALFLPSDSKTYNKSSKTVTYKR